MRIFGLILTICFYTINAYAEVSIDSAILGFNQVADSATNAASNCDGERSFGRYEVNLEGDPSLFHKEVKLTTKPSGETQSFKGDEVSVLTEDEANNLFEEFSKIDYMKFDYLHDGCFARAHEFALIAKRHGIEMGKVFLSDKNEDASLYPQEWLDSPNPPVPNGFVGWRYHVAPYVLVKKGGQLVPTVFDVGVASRPKSVSEWQESMIQDPLDEYRVTYRDRAYIFEGGNSTSEDRSNIAGQFEDQQLMRELGVDEFLFRREQGWL